MIRNLVRRWLGIPPMVAPLPVPMAPSLHMNPSSIMVSVHDAVGGKVVQASVYNSHGPDAPLQPRFVPDGDDLGAAMKAAYTDAKMLGHR